jgi:hypothetical protein
MIKRTVKPKPASTAEAMNIPPRDIRAVSAAARDIQRLTALKRNIIAISAARMTAMIPQDTTVPTVRVTVIPEALVPRKQRKRETNTNVNSAERMKHIQQQTMFVPTVTTRDIVPITVLPRIFVRFAATRDIKQKDISASTAVSEDTECHHVIRGVLIAATFMRQKTISVKAAASVDIRPTSVEVNNPKCKKEVALVAASFRIISNILI